MRAAAALAALLLLLANVADAAPRRCYRDGFKKDLWPRCQQLGDAALHWRMRVGFIEFGVDMPERVDWLGLGISPARMPGADIALLQHVGDAKWNLTDMHVEGFYQPEVDAQQDWKLLWISRSSSGLRVKLRRKLDTCDIQDNRVAKGEEVNMLMAWGVGPFKYHGPINRVYRAITLWPTPEQDVVPDLSEYKSWDLQMPNVTLPTRRTAYLCRHFALPLDTKRHIVGFQFVQGSALVHHLVIYGCPSAPLTAADGDVFECSALSEMHCANTLIIGAPGVRTSETPVAAGFPTGPGGLTYLAIQGHYDNPKGLEDVVDFSGFKVFYTEELRQHDMGVMLVGSQSFAPVAPGQEVHAMTPFACPSTCTRQFPHPITVSATFIHMHTAGISQITRHIRNGTELEPLSYINHYDFYNQRQVATNRTVLPGDSLLMTCTLNTTDRTNVTRGGLNSDDEMCYVYISYYPAIPTIEYCASSYAANYRAAACMLMTEAADVLEGKANTTALAMQRKIVPVPPTDIAGFKPLAQRCTFLRQTNGSVVGYSGYGAPPAL